jgi:hypothetical protein
MAVKLPDALRPTEVITSYKSRHFWLGPEFPGCRSGFNHSFSRSADKIRSILKVQILSLIPFSLSDNEQRDRLLSKFPIIFYLHLNLVYWQHCAFHKITNRIHCWHQDCVIQCFQSDHNLKSAALYVNEIEAVQIVSILCRVFRLTC